MNKTKIEWCDHTINPVAGCSKCSPGCDTRNAFYVDKDGIECFEKSPRGFRHEEYPDAYLMWRLDRGKHMQLRHSLDGLEHHEFPG